MYCFCVVGELRWEIEKSIHICYTIDLVVLFDEQFVEKLGGLRGAYSHFVIVVVKN